MITRLTLRKALRWAGLAALAIAVVFAVFAWVVFERRNEVILSKLESFLLRNQSGHLEVGSLDLRVLRNFPNLTLEIDSLVYHELADSLRSHDTAPIFTFNKLFLSIRLLPLIRGEVIVSEIALENGEVALEEDATGTLNIDRALRPPVKAKPTVKSTAPRKSPAAKPVAPSPAPKPAAASEAAQVNLNEIVLTNIRFSWKTHRKVPPQRWLVKSLTVSAEKGDSVMKTRLRAEVVAEDIRLNRAHLPSGPIALNASTTYHPASGQLDVSNASVVLDVFTISVQGFYNHRKGRILDLAIDGSSNDLPLLSKLLNKQAMAGNRDFLKSGDIFLRGKVFGSLASANPQFDLSFGISNLSFQLPGNLGAFKGLGFEGHILSGAAPDFSQAQLDIRNLRGQVPGGFIQGNFFVSNLLRPYVRCKVQSKLNLDGYDKIFQMDRVSDLKGQATLTATMDGPLRFLGLSSTDKKPVFDISFDLSGLSFRLSGRDELFEDIGIQGRCESGPPHDYSRSYLEFRSIRGKIPGGGINGEVMIRNLLDPHLHYRLSAAMQLEDLDRLLPAIGIRQLEGNLEFNGKFDGPLKLIGTHAMDSSRSSIMKFDSVAFTLARNGRRVSGLSGTLENQNNQADVHLRGTYATSDFRVKATVENLLHRLLQGERSLDARGTLEVDHLFTRDMLPDSAQRPILDDRLSALSLGFRIISETDTAADRARLRFTIKDFAARLDTLPDIRGFSASGLLLREADRYHLTLDNLHLRLPEGRVELSGATSFPGNQEVITQSKILITQLPWPYVSGLLDKLAGRRTTKNLEQANQMDILDAELNLSSTLTAYPFDFRNLTLTNSRFNFALSNGRVFAASQLDAALEPLVFLHPPNSGSITGLRTVRGNVTAGNLKVPGLFDLTVSLMLEGQNDRLIADLINRTDGAHQKGRLELDLSKPEPTWQLRYDAERLPIERIISRFHKGKLLEGPVNYTVELTTKGSNWPALRENLQGSLDVQADSMQFYGVDIDDLLRKFQKSQRINLADIGAVVLAGPVGIVATKGTDFVVLASAGLQSNQVTQVTKLRTRWNFEKQLLTTEDVAFATVQNRMTFAGSIDLANDSIPGIRVAVVDKNGCALMDQQLYGKFGKMKTGKLNVAKTLLGSVINFVDAIVGKDCKPVYTGSVRHPVSR